MPPTSTRSRPLRRRIQLSQRWAQALLNLLLAGLFSLLVLAALAIPFLRQPGWLFLLLIGGWLLFQAIQQVLSRYLQGLWRGEVGKYQTLLEAYNTSLRETNDLEAILENLCRTLADLLQAQSSAILLYNTEQHSLHLAVIAGPMPDKLYQSLPVDLDPTQLRGVKPVAALPESALKQGLLALNIHLLAAMTLNRELIGLICLGPPHRAASFPLAAQHQLQVLAGQSSLVIKNARLITDLEATVQQLALTYRRTIDAQEQERRSLAVEIHDDILGRLTTMTLSLRNCRTWLEKKPEQVQTWIEHLEQETQDVNRRLREITQGLHPTVLTDLGLIAALQAYLDSLARQAWPPSAPREIVLTAQGFQQQRLGDLRLERDIYNLTRQALDNAIKHAAAEQIFIHLHWWGDEIRITVQDTGKGLKDAPEVLMGQNGRLGLLSIHQRARAWGGQVNFASQAGYGTTIRAMVPVEHPSDSPHTLQVFSQYLERLTA